MTNIEMRLDDMEAKLDDLLALLQKSPARKGKAAKEEHQS
jgi:hypothetical protein